MALCKRTRALTVLMTALFYSTCFLFQGCEHEDAAPAESGSRIEEGAPGSQAPAQGDHLSFYYLCTPKGVINTTPCNPPGGNGLMGIARMVEMERDKGKPCLFLVMGDLFPKKRQGMDTFSVLHYDHDEAFLPRIYQAMEATAIMPGVSDLMTVGVRRVEAMCKEYQLNAVCANLLKEDGTPLFAPFVMAEMGGMKIGITGFISQKISQGDPVDDDQGGVTVRNQENTLVTDLLEDKGYEIMDPVSYAPKVAAMMKEAGAEFMVALSQTSVKRNKEILAETDFNLFIGNTVCKSDKFKMVPGGMFCTTERQCFTLGQIDLFLTSDWTRKMGDRSMLNRLEGEYQEACAQYDRLVKIYGTDDLKQFSKRAAGTEDSVWFRKYASQRKQLPPKIEAVRKECSGSYVEKYFHPVMGYVSDKEGMTGALWKEYKKSMETFLTEDVKIEIAEELEEREVKETFVLTDPERCAECHVTQHRFWKNTKHGNAFQVVRDMEYAYQPLCLNCHSTGYRLPGGFLFPPPPEKFGSVHCTVCHGQAEEHMQDFIIYPSHGNITSDPQKLYELCSFCHKKRRSPDFSFMNYLQQVACPKMDYLASPVKELLEERELELDQILAEEGKLASSDQYLRAAAYKRRLARDPETLVVLLRKGLEIDPYDLDLVHFIIPVLLGQKRSLEALDILETYVRKFKGNKEINLDIIRILASDQDEEVRDPEAAKSYIEWYLENLGTDNPEIYFLLALVEGQLGNVTEGWLALDEAERLNPNPMFMQKINQLRTQLKERMK